MDYAALTQKLQDIGWQKIAIVVATAIVLQLLVIWFVSWIIARKSGTFPNALKFYFSTKFLGVALLFVMYSGASFIRDQEFPSIVAVSWVLLCCAGIIAGSFVIPMKIYDISFFAVLGFAIVVSIFDAGLGAGTGYLAGKVFGVKITASQRDEVLDLFKKLKEQRQALLPLPDSSASPTPASSTAESTPPPPVRVAPPPVSTPRLAPVQVTLIEPVQIPAIINGQVAGQVTLPRGVQVKLISVQGDTLRIQYMDTIATIPRKSTDYPADAH